LLIDDKQMDSETNLEALYRLPEQEEPALSRLAKAIGYSARVRILRMLFRKDAQVRSQVVDELPLPRSTVSVHLRVVKDAQREITKIGRG
jgi:predicted transcriptional regulator